MTSTAAYLELNEAVALLDRMLDALLGFAPTKEGRVGSDLRRVIGDLRAHARDRINDATIGTALLGCFDAAVAAGVSFEDMDLVRQTVLAEVPVYNFGRIARASGVVLAVVKQSTLVAAMQFSSRSSVQVVLIKMIKTFESVKLDLADSMDSASYSTVTALAASVISHLYTTELRLPKIVYYDLGPGRSALELAQIIYGDGARFDDLIAENNVVHPAFFPSPVRALSE